MSPTAKIALVTGANRGLGLETCKQLAQLGITVILTSRHLTQGEKATQWLQQQGLPVIFHSLDVTQIHSIKQIEYFIRTHYGRLDILINNAGIFPDSKSQASAFATPVEVLKTAMETNLYGPFQLCQIFIQMMIQHQYGRVVNLSSGMGQLSEMNGEYPGYRTSKVALNALTRIFADELQGTDILINSVCPGWVRTDMGGAEAPRSVEEGVDTVVWLATLPTGGPSGGFFRDRQPIHW
ncbi:MAG: short-chain dehydrogenase [Beggiatoa sp. IS2]|nr:MAG: short-chain dehydrogenase [Beggiatoa sp. IS2]